MKEKAKYSAMIRIAKSANEYFKLRNLKGEFHIELVKNLPLTIDYYQSVVYNIEINLKRYTLQFHDGRIQYFESH